MKNTDYILKDLATLRTRARNLFSFPFTMDTVVHGEISKGVVLDTQSIFMGGIFNK
jgi:hypothetical protein